MTLADFLRKHNITPDKERGQHFLHNELVIERLVDEADLTGEETVLEIGAGIGNITKKLAEQAGQVIAYENDASLIPVLEEQVEPFDNVEIKEEDVLSGTVPEFDKCVSNIPFHLSSDIVEFLGEQQALSSLIVQDAFAQRLIAEPGTDGYSKMTIRANFDFSPVYIQEVYDINFTPPPETNVAIIKLFPNKGKYDPRDEPFFFHTVNALFMHKSKKTRNAFYNSRHMFDIDKDTARDIQDELPHSDDRVFTLTVKQLVDVADALGQLLGR